MALALAVAMLWTGGCSRGPSGEEPAAPRQAAPVPVESAPAAPAAYTPPGGPSGLTAQELGELVAPIALYPDELLAVVLPASTYPLDVVKASRFLEDRESDPSLEPDLMNWDPSIVALLNYPEVLDLLNEDLDWTWKLGEAVVNQMDDVIDAIQQFRHQVYAAGNLASSDQQIVIQEREIIRIESPDPEVIYVPVYEPMTVVQPYYSGGAYAYPVRWSVGYPCYWSPRASFWTGMFWGSAIGYSIGWNRRSIDINRNVNVNVGGGGRGGGGWQSWKPGGGDRGRPGDRPGDRPGTRPGDPPRTRPGDRPGDRPGSRQGGRAGSWPESRQADRADSRPRQTASDRARSERQGGGFSVMGDGSGSAGSQGALRPGSGQGGYSGSADNWYENRQRPGQAGPQSGSGSFNGYSRSQDAYRQSSRGYQSRGGSSRPSSGYQQRPSSSGNRSFGGHSSGSRAKAHSSRGAGSRSRGGGRGGGGRR